MYECPFCLDLSIEPDDAINHGFPYIGQTIGECESCHAKVNIDFDYSFEDGSWRDCSTVRPLKALCQ
jgi:hypothetical protein